jgi:hypothetical protein
MFEVDGREVTERAMESDAVVVGFDVLEDHLSGFLMSGGKVGGKAFGLECAPERFHHDVVVAIGPSAHTGHGADLLEQLALSDTGVLTATIGVDEEAGPGTAALAGLT